MSDNSFEIVNGVLVRYKGNDTEVVIPDGVTSIGRFAFDHCDFLTDVTLPEGVTSIGEHAFLYCTNLRSINIPYSVTSIENFAFCNCRSLCAVTIPQTATCLGLDIFASTSFLLRSRKLIRTTAGSAAHMYALKNRIDFELI